MHLGQSREAGTGLATLRVWRVEEVSVAGFEADSLSAGVGLGGVGLEAEELGFQGGEGDPFSAVRAGEVNWGWSRHG